MAANIELDEGSSGKYTETDEVASGVHRQVMKIGGVSACRLARQRTASQTVTCTAANTDYSAASALSSWAKYVRISCPSDCIVAMGEATSGSVGVAITGGMSETFPVTYTGITAYDTVHVRSPVAFAAVRITQLAD